MIFEWNEKNLSKIWQILLLSASLENIWSYWFNWFPCCLGEIGTIIRGVPVEQKITQERLEEVVLVTIVEVQVKHEQPLVLVVPLVDSQLVHLLTVDHCYFLLLSCNCTLLLWVYVFPRFKYSCRLQLVAKILKNAHIYYLMPWL